MCELMAKRKASGLQFLELDEFIKTPNGYRTALGTHCMYKGIELDEPRETPHTVCERDKYCNAVLDMDIIKRGNNLTGSKFTIMTY